jgi:hypothetical protein
MVHAYERETDPDTRQRLLASWKANKGLVIPIDDWPGDRAAAAAGG